MLHILKIGKRIQISMCAGILTIHITNFKHKSRTHTRKGRQEKEFNYNQNFVSRITSTLTQIENIESIDDVTTDIESLLSKAEEMRKLQFSYSAEMSVLENEIYVNQHKLHMVEHNLVETKKDIEFAMTQKMSWSAQFVVLFIQTD